MRSNQRFLGRWREGGAAAGSDRTGIGNDKQGTYPYHPTPLNFTPAKKTSQAANLCHDRPAQREYPPVEPG